MPATTTQRRDYQKDLDDLRQLLPPGTTVYTVLRHVSSSGMLRVISPVVIHDGTPFDITWRVALALGWRRDDKRDGIRVTGAGQDMGWHLVYALSAALYPDGFPCIEHKYPESRCPSNDHISSRILGEQVPYHHRDGGYALLQRWL